MKIHSYIIITVTCFLLHGCKINMGHDRQGRIIMRQPFEEEKVINPTFVPIDTMIAFENWSMGDSLLWVESNGTENFFYALRSNDFKIKHALGKKGDGPEEFVMPHLVQGASELIVLDNALHSIRWLSLETGLIEREKRLSLQNTYWQPCYFDRNTLCFIQNSPNELMWAIYDMNTQEIIDSLLFADKTGKGNAIQYEFVYYVDTVQLAIAFSHDNAVSYYKI